MEPEEQISGPLLLQIIGAKEARLVLMAQEIARLQAALAEAQKPPAVTPPPDGAKKEAVPAESEKVA